MTDWRAVIDHEIDALAGDLRAVRRHLHANPEPSREEFETTRFLAARLEAAGICHRIVPSGRGIVAVHDPAPVGRAVALRADMDALRIKDAKEVCYRSTRDGVMHACGHDAHTAMALGAALALRRCGDVVPWPVPWRVIFQPAEEVSEGAAEMVAAGAVEDADAIVALHVAPDLTVGKVALRSGVMTSFCQDIDVAIRGVGGHAARPHLTIDPIAATAQLITAVYQTLPRSIDSRDPVVVSFGAVAGGTNSNVIPERVLLRGTLRAMGRGSAARVRERIAQIARGVAEATQTKIDLSFGHETDAVVNDPGVSAVCTRAAAEVLGPENVEAIPLPSMGAEDFSGYLDHTPGCMMRLGVAPDSTPYHALHSPHFDIDERALVLGAKVLAHSAVLLAQRIAGHAD